MTATDPSAPTIIAHVATILAGMRRESRTMWAAIAVIAVLALSISTFGAVSSITNGQRILTETHLNHSDLQNAEAQRDAAEAERDKLAGELVKIAADDATVRADLAALEHQLESLGATPVVGPVPNDTPSSEPATPATSVPAKSDATTTTPSTSPARSHATPTTTTTTVPSSPPTTLLCVTLVCVP